MNTRKSLITITSLTATFVALCAAVFSVTGIAKLFAGAALSAGVMASALELGKIVSISFLYQYWKEIPKTLKYYLSTAAIILMVITSAGIYGYLSSAYAKVAATPLQLNADIKSAEGRGRSIEQDIQRKNDRLNQLINLRSQQETRLDNLVSKSTTGSNTTIRNAQSALTQADNNVVQLQKEISALSTVRDSLNGVTIGKQVEIETNSDIGTFIYIAKVFGTTLDTVVKWFTLIIVLVFDPLAVALVISVNFLIKNAKSTTEEKQYTLYPDDTVTVENPLIVEKVDVDENTGPATVEESIIQEIDTMIPTDPNYFTNPDFDWANKSLWKNDQNAVNYYNSRINSRV